MYGCEECYGDPYCDCGWDDGFMTGCDCGSEFIDGEVIYEGEWEMDGGWTEIPSDDCPHCMNGQTVETYDVPMPLEQHVESPQPLVPAPMEEETAPAESPATEEGPATPEVTHTSDEYYMPRPMPTAPPLLQPATSEVVVQPNDPVKPVLWVPTGL